MSNPIDRASLEAFREDAIEIMSEWENTCLRSNSIPPAESFRALLRCAHNLKGNAGLMGFTALRDTIHRLEERLLELSRVGAKPNEITLLGLLIEIEKYFRAWLNQIVDNPDFVPDNSNIISRLEVWSPESTATAKDSSATPTPASLSIADDGTVRIPGQKLETLIQLVSELTLAQAIVSRAMVNNRLNQASAYDAISSCDKLVRALRLNVLDMRMLPIVGLYKKLERACMELSVQLNKPIKFLTEGHDVSADKAVLNRIFDPLLHIVRNAIDHGIESQAERKNQGKPLTGTLTLAAEVVPAGVLLRVKDDGRGISLDKIRERAKSRGLISVDRSLTDAEAAELIFEPGFSTADAVTDVSGRGVGMDVVKKEVIGLGGQIEFTSTPGAGTEFRITLPANISLIDVLVVSSGGQNYCIPIQDIIEAVNAEDVLIAALGGFSEAIDLRGLPIPVEDLSFFLPALGHTPKPEGRENTGYILIVQFQDHTVGIRVDHVVDQQQVFVRPLKGYLASLPRLTGSTILSSGDPSLVVNVKEMANDYFLNQKRGVDLGESPA